jgi:hypothetical protein
LYRQLDLAKQTNNEEKIKRLQEEIKLKKRGDIILPDFTNYKPSYFNSGCCCFSDGDITGIEITNGMIRLVKWKYTNAQPQRILLEEVALEKFLEN